MSRGEKPTLTYAERYLKKCSKPFKYRMLKDGLRISFPITLGNEAGVACLEIRDENVKVYGPEVLRDLIKEVNAGLEGKEVTSQDLIRKFFTGLSDRYHEELAKLDSIIEELVNEVVKGGARVSSLYKVYWRAVKLHKGVHGIIYALRKASTLYEDLQAQVGDAVMLENMYSTSIDRVTDAFNLHYTVMSEKTNNVVTKLTVISAIFLPLTLIAGIYGMNFKYMPELNHPLAYPITLIAMAAIVVAELTYFKKRRWI